MSTISNRIPTFIRLALGALFFVFGLDGFFHFAPHPPMNDQATQFLGALAATGYMFPLIKGTEVVVGALLLSGRFVPLALTVLAPIIVNIVLFHTVLSPQLPLVVFLLSAEIYLAYSYRLAFSGVLNAQARPVQAQSQSEGRVAHAV
jgi:uncharacterized membrane protein YphA (DoxX/SURF4 family)